MIEFTATGPPRVVSHVIEACAGGQWKVTALVVPWESERVTLRLKADTT